MAKEGNGICENGKRFVKFMTLKRLILQKIISLKFETFLNRCRRRE